MKTRNYQGKNIEVVELDIITNNEHWNEYQLSAKLIVVKVFKAVSEKTLDGEPLYLIESQNVVKAKVA